MDFRSKGTMILRWKGANYKVLAFRSPGRKVHHYQRLNIETGKPETPPVDLG